MASFSSICARCFVRSLLSWNNKSWQHLPTPQCASWRHRSATPCSGRRALIQLVDWTVECYVWPSTGAVSILHRDDRGDMDHTELCSVQTSPTDVIAGTVGNARKCRKTSTLWILNVRKSQLCFHIFHLTPWDSQASFCATAIWNEFNLHSQTAGCSERRFYHKCTRGAYFVCSLRQESQEQCAGVTNWDTAFRKAQSTT